MPVIVIGADTASGDRVIDGLINPPREVRAFVTDPDSAIRLKERGVKVALGDLSDVSHVEGASLRCFSAVLIAEAAEDDRERSFAATPEEVMRGWARAVERSGVKRVIWVAAEIPPSVEVDEVAVVNPDERDLAARVVALDDAQEISRP